MRLKLEGKLHEVAALKSVTLRRLNVEPPIDIAVYTVNDSGTVEMKLLDPTAKFVAEQPMKIGANHPKTKKLLMPTDGS